LHTTQNTRVNPAWSTALCHIVYSQLWPDETSTDGQKKYAEHVRKQVEMLRTISEGSQSGSYMNEADPFNYNIHTTSKEISCKLQQEYVFEILGSLYNVQN
jgi:hypothetical protein